MSPKSRRPHKRLSNGNTTDSSRNNNSNIAVAAPEEGRPRPRLHAHHRIFSGPLGAEQPLTIDQHLSIYRRSLISPALTTTTIAAASKSFSPGFTAAEEEAIDMFYQHRPLTFSADAIANITGAPSLTTLLGPSIGETQLLPAIAEYQNRNDQQQREQQDDWSPSSSDGLLQLAHVVSTFG
ncbi:hypothetical protein BX666DRAFT_2154309 [Dichotomocladium elegans]|nr:hypothetical protein BX666DRAFT_2154309 [Dichotomocladium elegans]